MRQFSLTPPFGGCCHLQMRLLQDGIQESILPYQPHYTPGALSPSRDLHFPFPIATGEPHVCVRVPGVALGPPPAPQSSAHVPAPINDGSLFSYPR